MDLLVLGGTVFLGRHVVEGALARGHTVTLFNRGRRNPDLFPEVEKLRGDRAGDLTSLAGRRWDAVIDTSGYVPRHVRASAALLADQVEHYTFISSISVYADTATAGMDESAPLGRLEDETVEEVNGETYGPLKALCEQATETALPRRALSVRAGLIVGPHDPSGRFTYWPARLARGGETLAPGRSDDPVQVIDGRDLAGWLLDMAERRQAGVYNATSPAGALTMGDVLAACQREAASGATLTWVEDAFLVEREVGPWLELPLWIPQSAETAGFYRVDCRRAEAAGLRCRPIADTVRDTLTWLASLPAQSAPAQPAGVGLTPEREAELLAAWHARVYLS